MKRKPPSPKGHSEWSGGRYIYVGSTKKPKPPLERDIQRSIVQWLKAQGWNVWQTSQGYRPQPGGTRMTRGLPDLYAVNLRHGAIWIEVKRGTAGKVRPDQQAFHDLHEDEMAGNEGIDTIPRALIAYSLDDVRTWFEREGWSREVT